MPFTISHGSFLNTRFCLDDTESKRTDRGSFESLLPEILRGDQHAAERLVNGLYPSVIRIIRRRIPPQLAEEDVAQEVFLRMFRKLHQFRGQSPFEHWVARIALRTCLNQLRGQRLQVELRRADLTAEEERTLENLVSPNCPFEQTNSRDLLDRLLISLSPKERMLIEMLDLEGRTSAETADLLGISAIALRVRASRARARLRKHLNRLLEDEAH